MEETKLKVEYIDADKLLPYQNNARVHGNLDVDAIMASIEKFGFTNPILTWRGIICAGHGRLLAAKRLGLKKVPTIALDYLSDAERRAYILADNKTAELSEWDFNVLGAELQELSDFDMSEFGFEIGDFDIEDNYANGGEKGSLQRDFIVPPFSVLDSRQGYWLERKREWKRRINDTSQARDVAIIASNINRGAEASILDPSLSEVILQWFTPHPGSNVFDCFAGDTVFGYVSGSSNHNFTGIELRQEQADFNNDHTLGISANYICDDGRNVCKYLKQESQDLFFSCPPYYDLEVYSDDPNDASNQESYEDFYNILDTAFSESIKCLAQDRFAVIVAGNVRDKSTGGYYNFVGDIINTFIRNGMFFYNDMILIDPIGSAGIRARKSMEHRKVVKVHQNVLVFYKGDQKNIKKLFPKIEVQIDESEDEQVVRVDN